MATGDRGSFDSLDEVCAQTQGPPVTRTGYNDLSHRDPHGMATGDRGPFDPFDEVCTQTQGPPTTRSGYDYLSRRDPHELHKQKGYARKDSKASPCARLQ